MANRPPNIQLRALLVETGWTGEQLASAVNKAGGELGLDLTYNRSAVTHWMSGMKPRPPVPQLVAEVLSRKLARPISPREAGFEPQADKDDGRKHHRPAPWWEADPVPELINLDGRQRRTVLTGLAYSLATLAIPSFPTAVSAAPPYLEGTGSVSAEQVAGVELMVEVFSSADSIFGGGHSRPALGAYLAHTVAPLLRSRAPARLKRRLYAAATKLTYLCAFMCFDEQLNGAAQRYYQISMRLAADNSDALGYAVALRAMSVQAFTLRHPNQVATLSEAALSAVHSNAPPHLRAFLHGQAAVGAAVTSDRARALSHLATAERLLETGNASTENGPIGVYHPASLAHQKAEVLASLGDTLSATRILHASIADRPETERRSRAITLARLAELNLDSGNLEQATSTWSLFLLDYPHLRSGRASAALTELKARLRPYQRDRAAASLLRRATAHH